MVEINLESMKNVETKDLGGNRCLVTLIDCDGSKIEIVTTKDRGSWIYDSIEKVCINKAYQYQTMQDEIDRLELENDELRESARHTLRYEVAI